MTAKRIWARALCPVCRRSVRVTKSSGRLMKHLDCVGGFRSAGFAPPVKTEKNKVTRTRVAIVMDTSSSMRNIKTQAERAFQEFCGTLNNQDENYGIDVWTFSYPSSIIRQSFNLKPGQIGRPSFYMYGMTALYDAIAAAAKGLGDDEDTAFLVLVITDGYENASRKYTPTSLRRFLKEKQETGRWTFALSVPKGSAQDIAQNLGLPLGNVTEWDDTKAGTLVMGQVQTSALESYTSERSLGKTQSKTFYLNLNIGRQNTNELVIGMKPEPKSRFRSVKASRAMTIEEAVTAKKLVFVTGKAYYALLKPETVAPHKALVIRRKDTGEVFAGPYVRQNLGIPTDREARLSPGNMGEWDVFIQSTSNNRKLLSKMEVLFDKQ